MVPHKQTRARHSILEAFYNKQLSCVRVIIENSFNVLKKKCWELMIKSNLNVKFHLDVVICYSIPHNMILNGKDVDIDELMLQLEVKNVGEMRHGVTQ
jgi:uncharacterized protein (DUF1919 family)